MLWLLALLMMGACRTGPAQWGPFRGQVVDAETGRPISGAYVMVRWVREPPNLHVTQWFYDAQETTTDTSGRFELPRRTRFLTAFVIAPGVSVFAPGYFMQAPEVTPPDGRKYVEPTVVKMRPLKTREELCEYRPGSLGIAASRGAPRYAEAALEYVIGLNCHWPEGK